MKFDPPDVPIGPVFEHYGGQLPYSQRAGWQKVRCFLHEDRNPSATINRDINRYFCFSCGVSEDTVGLVMHVDGLDFLQAKERAVSISGEVSPRARSDWRTLLE